MSENTMSRDNEAVEPAGEHATGQVSACKDIVWKIGPFVDGELPADERAQVESHLAACKDCVQMAIDFRRLDTLAANDHAPQVSGEEWARLWQGVVAGSHKLVEPQVISLPRPLHRRNWFLPLVSTAAAALMGLAIGYGYFGGSGAGSQRANENTGENVGREGEGTAGLPTDPEPTISEENDVIIIDYSKPIHAPVKPSGR